MLFAEFRADPENNPLRTPSGRIELYSDEIARFADDDCPPHPAWIEPAEWLGGGQTSAFPLHLVSSQPRHRLHNQMDAGPVSARGKIAGREALAINPVDARSRGIGDGEVVHVVNARVREAPIASKHFETAGSGSTPASRDHSIAKMPADERGATLTPPAAAASVARL